MVTSLIRMKKYATFFTIVLKVKLPKSRAQRDYISMSIQELVCGQNQPAELDAENQKRVIIELLSTFAPVIGSIT